MCASYMPIVQTQPLSDLVPEAVLESILHGDCGATVLIYLDLKGKVLSAIFQVI